MVWQMVMRGGVSLFNCRSTRVSLTWPYLALELLCSLWFCHIKYRSGLNWNGASTTGYEFGKKQSSSYRPRCANTSYRAPSQSSFELLVFFVCFLLFFVRMFGFFHIFLVCQAFACSCDQRWHNLQRGRFRWGIVLGVAHVTRVTTPTTFASYRRRVTSSFLSDFLR